MRKSGGEPMSCGYSPTPPAACAWSAHSPSKPTKTGSKPTATSIWTNCASRRKPNYAKPHDQHHDRQFAELDAHNPSEFPDRPTLIAQARESIARGSKSFALARSEEHTTELQSLMRISYAVFCLKNKKQKPTKQTKPHL